MNRLKVSITSYPRRFKMLNRVLESLENQTYKDFDVVITLYKQECENDLEYLNKIVYNSKLNIEVNFVDTNTYCHKNTFEVMKLYPDKFANDVVLVSPPYDNNGQTNINLRFSEYFNFHDYLPEDEFTLYDWISNIQDKTTAYVIESIVEKALKNEVLSVPALKSEYKKGDFEGFYGAIKAKEESDDDKAVQKAIQNNNMPDLHSLGIASSMPKERVEAAIKRLVAIGQIDEEYLNIKDRIDPFEKGDLIKLTDAAFEKEKSQLFYSNNVFKILELFADGSVRLSNINQPVSISDIEAIKIDGVLDRDIYYDPIVAASIVPYDAPAPVSKNHRGEYYMDGLENTTYNNKTFKQLVLEADCRYVHEVQHYLRKHFKTDDLKVDERVNI